MFVQKRAWEKGCGVEREVRRRVWRVERRSGALRVCWLKRRIRVGGLVEDLDVDGGGDSGERQHEVNHSPATVMLSVVWPPSRYHVMSPSLLVSQRPPHFTVSKPRMNSAGRGSVESSENPMFRRWAAAT